MKKLTIPMIILFSFIFVIGAATDSALAGKEKPILLKVPSTYSAALPGLGTTTSWVAERLHIASNGSLKMKVYEPGKLIAPFEILDAVSSGKVNAGYSISGYWEGKMPGSSIFSTVPFGPEAGEFLAWMYHGNGRKLYQEMYDQGGYNVHVIPCGIIAPETGGWFKKEINSLEDIKGLKIRYYGLGGKVLQKLGASVSLIPGGEIFPALEKNAIEATEFSMPAIDTRLGFYKVAKYNYFPGWHQQATFFELLINKDTWNSMSESQQMLLEIICKAATCDAYAFTESLQAKVMVDNVENHGVENKYYSKELLDAFENAWEEVAEELSAESPFFKKSWEDLQAFRATYDLWENYAFLPRGLDK
ncbi:TRAP transporter substrate-binding protein [uncultured Desulfosarcina sp.]|uniref:TRAP transporter substrate-binding protein n=1 Tax=uncultured Desulfosarcina sp. TaxID=218289 RepID=UPI0029C66485|nr:TRAP transporter substrate-binding protein [uncultured Desulfosarcina sp.]